MIHLPRPIWQLAWPIILSNITIPLLGLVDTAMVGNAADTQAIATVAIGSVIFDFLFWGFGFLRMATTGLVAQQPHNAMHFYRSALLALLLALILIACSPWAYLISQLFSNKAQIQAELTRYLSIRLFSAPATLLNYVILGYCFGRQRTKLAWALLTFTNILAIFLDYVFVWQLHLASSGIAYSNVIAQTSGAIVGGLALYKLYLNQHSLSDFWPRLFDWPAIKRLAQLNQDIFIRTLVLMTTQAFFTYQGTQLGLTIVAANAILMHLQMICAYGLDGFAIAAESLVGNAIGQADSKQVFITIKGCSSWSFIVAMLFSILFLLGGNYYLSVMTDIELIRATAKHYLPWLIALPLLSLPSFLLDGVYIGATWSKPLRNTIVFAAFFMFLPIWFVTQSWGNHGLWFAYCSFIIGRGLYLGLDFYYKRITTINTLSF